MKQMMVAMILMTAVGDARGQAPVQQTIVSASPRASLVELFTSEGCSSCPPAEAWFSDLTKSERLWKDVVPVAFHVDYWDYLGWQDAFARPAFSERQRDYAEAWKSDRVYTPGFVLNGAEWSGWRTGQSLPTAKGNAGTLTLDIASDGAMVRFEPANAPKGALDAHIAVLGMGVSRKILAGENKGKTLAHDFVVLDYQQLPLKLDGGAWRGRGRWNGAADPAPSKVAVAVWVTEGGRGEPVQVAGAALNEGALKALQLSQSNGGNGMDKVTKTDAEWRQVLTDEEFRVAREKGTETAFTGRYWNNHAAGIYLCVACGQALFSSDTKFESGTGWPSFYEPVDDRNVEGESDQSHGMDRTEVMCSRCGSHLGHVFDDGPKPTGLRYCINSAALKFAPKDPGTGNSKNTKK